MMDEKDFEDEIDPVVIPKPEPKPEKEKDILKCPKGFPQKKWDKWGVGAKRDYIRITGGTE